MQRTLRLPLLEATGGVVGAAGRFQGRPPLDRGGLARNCGDRQSPEEVAFSRLLGTGEAQVGVRVNTYVYSSSIIFVPAQGSLHRFLRKPRRPAPGSTLLGAALYYIDNIMFTLFIFHLHTYTSAGTTTAVTVRSMGRQHGERVGE